MFIILYKAILTFESVDAVIKCENSNKSYWEVHLYNAVSFLVYIDEKLLVALGVKKYSKP